MHIKPLHGLQHVKQVDRNEGRIIFLGSDRKIDGANPAVDVRTGQRLLVCQGGFPLDDGTTLLPSELIVRIDNELQQPYIHIAPEEVARARSLDLPISYFSGWYTILESYDHELDGRRCVPIYGTPRIMMADGTEYCHIDAIGVVEVPDV